MKKIFLMLVLISLSNLSFSSKLDDIQTQLDNMEVQQQARDNERQLDKDIRDIQQLRGVVGKNNTLRYEAQHNPSKYRLIGKDGSLSLYIELPINRFSKKGISFALIALSDEVLQESGMLFSQIIASSFMFCDTKTVNFISPMYFNFDGKFVFTGPMKTIKYQQSSAFMKIDGIYCQ